MTTNEKYETVMGLLDRADNIENHKELSVFLGDLLNSYEDGHFEEQGVVDYLEGMSHLLRALDSWYRNNEWGDGAPAQPDWSLMARLLISSFYHS